MSAQRIKKSGGEAGESIPQWGPRPVMTIGHSTRTLEEFIRMLQGHGATCVVDVRTVPRSRFNPQFNKDSLPLALRQAGLGYVHMPGLGGLRHPRPNSPNRGWLNASFRGFADYMQTPEFAQNLDELIRLADRERIVLMCAEALPWRCHRSLIADALLARGIRTENIMGAIQRQVHALTPFARVRGTTVTYPTWTVAGAIKKSQAKRSRPRPVANSAGSAMGKDCGLLDALGREMQDARQRRTGADE